MAYIKTNWQDRVVEKPRTYIVIDNPDGTVTLTPAPGAVVQEGTPVNAINLNKVEQGVDEIHKLVETDIHTPDQSQTAQASGTLLKLKDYFANILQRMLGTGTLNWYDTPPITLSATKSHTEASAAHGATSQAVAGKIVVRDAYGRAKVAAPSAADDIARLDSITKAQVGLGNVTNDKQATKVEFDAKMHATTGHKHDGTAGDGPKIPSLENLILDQYNLHMELYYTGHHSGPSIAGLAGMTFDGFVDTSRVDVANTTATISNATAVCTGSSAKLGGQDSTVSGNYIKSGSYPAQAFRAPFTGYFRGLTLRVSKSGSPKDLVVDLYTPKSTGRPQTFITTLGTIPASSISTSMTYIQLSMSPVAIIQDELYSIVLHQADWGGDTSNYVRIASVTKELFPRGLAFMMYAQDMSSGDQMVDSSYVMSVDVHSGYNQNVLRSTSRQLENQINSVVCYASTKCPSGTSVQLQISADGGIHWENLTLQSSRQDPQYSEFTEGRYTCDLLYPGNKVILKALLNPKTLESPVFKRYGLYWL